MPELEIAHGLCRCGCGQQTPIAPRNRPERGWIKGEPRPFIKGHHRPKYATLADYFWTYCTRGNPSECWVWTGATTEGGYGVMNYRGKMYYAHRVAWELENKRPLPPKKFGCHECDNPGCPNPHHVWPGGVKENAEDMVSKDRQARGERNGHAKLMPTDIAAIRQRAETGEMFKTIALDFGCKGSYIGQIVRYERWAHLP